MSRYTFLKSVLLLFIFCHAIPQSLHADDGPAVLQWRSFLPYNEVVDMDYYNGTFYCATTSGFFTYNKEDGMLQPYSKTNGMNDIGMSKISFDALTKTAVLTYDNGNIDLWNNFKFENISELRLTNISGDKTIYDVITHHGIAYISTGIGLVLLDIDRREIKETVTFYDSSLNVTVFASKIKDNQVYAATANGIYRSEINNPFIQNYATWDKISNLRADFITEFEGLIYTGNDLHVYVLKNDDLQIFKNLPYPISSLNASYNGLWVGGFSQNSENYYGYLLNEHAEIIDSVPCRRPTNIISLADGTTWFSDNSNAHFPHIRGFRKKISPTESQAFIPEGPIIASTFDVDVYNGEIWMAHGGYNHIYHAVQENTLISKFSNGSWYNYPWLSDNIFVQDFVRILKNHQTGEVYASSFSGGLFIFKPDGSWKEYGVGYFAPFTTSTNYVQTGGLALDKDGNLWITTNGSPYELTVRTPEDEWYAGTPVLGNAGGALPHSALDIVIDDYNQKWVATTNRNGGIFVYDDNGTITDNSDDRYKMMRAGEGNGGLPSATVYSIAKDKDGNIWVGTDNGIGIINCAGSVFENNECEAYLKVVTYDGINENLFANQSVNAIEVDAANRKWIGTNNGLWLISEDGEEEIFKFSADNSPLPSNVIRRINIDPVNGDVYISTDKGLVSFRSTATRPKDNFEEEMLIYPNPVPPNFEGMIAIRDLPDRSDVRITDIKGQLVYRTTSLGGQAVWNGKDYLGRKAQSGVYLVFVVSRDGTQKKTGKFMIQR